VYNADRIKKYDEGLNIPLSSCVTSVRLAITTHLTFPPSTVCALRAAQRSLLMSPKRTIGGHLHAILLTLIQPAVPGEAPTVPSRLDRFRWFADHRNPQGPMVSSSIRTLGSLAFLNIPPAEQGVESGNTPLVGTPESSTCLKE